jgi:hypothetical protein
MNMRYFQVIKPGEQFVLISEQAPESYELKNYEGRLGLRIGVNLKTEKAEYSRFYYSALLNEGADPSKKVLEIGTDNNVAYGLYLMDKKSGPIDLQETRELRLLHNPKREPVGFVNTQTGNGDTRCKNCHSKHYTSYDSAVFSTDTCQCCGSSENIP